MFPDLLPRKTTHPPRAGAASGNTSQFSPTITASPNSDCRELGVEARHSLPIDPLTLKIRRNDHLRQQSVPSGIEGSAGD